MKLKLVIVFLCLAGIMTAMAEPYEVLLATDPPGADAYLYLVHPFNMPDNTNYGTSHYYFDCQPTVPQPDWGVKGWDGDDPWLNNNWTYGVRKIRANILNDPGDCWVKVAYLGSGSALCTVTVTNWRGAQPVTFTKNMSEGDAPWYVTNLPCAQNMKLNILKAKQNRTSGRLKIKALICHINPMTETTTYFRASLDSSEDYSLRVEEWMHYTTEKNVKIRKEGTVGKFGKPISAIIKIKDMISSLVVKGQGRNMYQNRPLRVFIALGGCSGYQLINMDAKSKYKADVKYK
ncbi:MAG: hypothetical protein DRI44_01260 [Chlamydiae bacterium]|nr:MAG: hypothetical protein DRI44_01260 [Chlamydiota bacterium]